MKYLFSDDPFVQSGVLATEKAVRLMDKNPMTPKDFGELIESVAKSMQCTFEEAEDIMVRFEPAELKGALKEKLDRCYDFLFMELTHGTC